MSQEQDRTYGTSKVKVTFLASEWGSSKGGLSTINRELAIQLAKCPEVEITFLLPQCSEEDKKVAIEHNVKIVEAPRLTGYEEIEWLCSAPENLQIDIVVGHGVKLGRQAQVIRNYTKCKWVQVVHTDPEELAMFKDYSDPISKGEEKHKTEVELCEKADQVVGVGPKLSEAFRSYLSGCQKHENILDFTPGVFEEFVSVKQAPDERKNCSVLVFGRGDAEDFALKGFDIAGKAAAALPDTRLVFVGAPDGTQEEIKKRLTECGVPASRLKVRGYLQNRESLKRLFQEVNLVLMPSRTEGFGLTGLEALSAGLPVLVSRNSGFGETLSNVPFGSSYVIDSEDPKDWAAAIKHIWDKDRKRRLEEVEILRDSYQKKYNWTMQIKDLLDTMISMVHADSSDGQIGSKRTKRGMFPSAGEASQQIEYMPEHHTDESQVVHVGAMTRPAPLCTGNHTFLYNAPDIHGGDSDRGQLRSDFAVHAVMTAPKLSGGNNGSPLVTRGHAPAATAPTSAPAAPDRVIAVTSCSQTLAGQKSRLQHVSSVGPTPVTYANFLAREGYCVEIIGGEHFKTPDREYVEMKSGTQYQIHVKNSRAYGCHLDISIDGYDVGGWIIDGGQELTIERSAYEARKFTFYRVQTAPKEAGIEAGRLENGVIQCVFTPEAFLDIAVVIPGLSQPHKVNIDPSATVGDLKHEVQCQLNAASDPSQILVLDDKELSNVTHLREVVKSPGNLILIDVELEITVEASSNVIFAVKIQPGKAKVHDLMEQIQRKLDVPIKDQKLYHERALLSDAPERGLPQTLICSLQPSVLVTVPEYINITVENLVNGDSSIVKIDQELTLRDLVEEIPSCRNLPENEEAMFYFYGQELCPSRDEATLTNLGICSGSKLELKVKIIFIEINVVGLPSILPTLSIGIRCSPQETFKDLLNKLDERCNTGKLEGATFATPERIFDPEQDQDPLQDYGFKHGSALVIRLAKPQPKEESARTSAQLERRTSQSDDSEMELKSAGEPLCEGEKLMSLEKEMKGSTDAELQDYGNEAGFPIYLCGQRKKLQRRVLAENDPAWRAGGTTLQGYSTQQFIAADPIKVDRSKKVVLVLRLVAREDETDFVFPEDELKPLSTRYPPAVPE